MMYYPIIRVDFFFKSLYKLYIFCYNKNGILSKCENYLKIYERGLTKCLNRSTIQASKQASKQAEITLLFCDIRISIPLGSFSDPKAFCD